MIGKIVLNALFIILCALLLMAYRRIGFSDLEPQNIVIGLLLIPIFAGMMWLRWDWAPENRRRQRDADENKNDS